MKNSVLIIGANQGIGLQFAKTYTSRGWTVYGSVRTESRDEAVELSKLGAQIMELDLNNEETIAKAASNLKDVKLDVLLNVAGVGPNPTLWTEHTKDILMDKLETNVVGPFLTCKYFYENVASSPMGKIVNLTSGQGSIEDNNRRGRNMAYRVSKAALNQFTKTLALEFQELNSPVITFALSPGWIPTKMTGYTGPGDIEVNVEKMVNIINEADRSRNGQFLNVDAEQLKW